MPPGTGVRLARNDAEVFTKTRLMYDRLPPYACRQQPRHAAYSSCEPMLPPSTYVNWRGLVRIPQMLRTPPLTWGHTFSNVNFRRRGTMSTIPIAIAASTTISRINLLSPSPGFPTSFSDADWPTMIAETTNRPNCAIVPESPASTPEEVAAPISTPCFCRNRMFITAEAAPD